MTPLEILRADLARAHAKLGRIQNKARTQLHILDMINDILLLLRRYATSLHKADADLHAPPGVPRLDLRDPGSSELPPQPPTPHHGKHQ